MASQSIVSFSGSYLQVDDIAQYYQDTTSSIQLYFSLANPEAERLFAEKSKEELQYKLNEVSEENELLISMSLLSALEAAFRIDYLQRCYKKKKDSLSRAFQQIHQQKGNRASLEDDIFDAWKQHTNVPNHLVSELKGAFKYRHWLAHGRYWEPKLGRKYDYFSVYTLGQTVVSSFPLEVH
jgi:uncharacterized protein YutE (UPF0331/DUF86 family)